MGISYLVGQETLLSQNFMKDKCSVVHPLRNADLISCRRPPRSLGKLTCSLLCKKKGAESIDVDPEFQSSVFCVIVSFSRDPSLTTIISPHPLG